MLRHKRRIYFVDREMQGKLLLRVAKYWLFSVAAVGVLTTLGWLFISPGIGGLIGSEPQLVTHYSSFFIAVLASFLILPFVLVDAVRFSNRFAGPMFRLRRCMQELAEGKPVRPIHFRDGDFWDEMATAFNGVLVRIDQEQGATQQDTEDAYDELEESVHELTTSS